MEDQHPSTLLIETWIELAQNDNFPEAQHFSIKRLNDFFGSPCDAEQYLEKNRIS